MKLRRNPMLERYPNEIAKTYGVGVHKITHNRQLYCIKRLLDTAEAIDSPTSALDCPCGSGRLSGLLVKYNLICADRSEKRLTQARSMVSGTDIKFERCDIFNLPFPDSSFDLVLNALLLQHIEKDKLPTLFQELSRITKSWLIITYSTTFSLLSILRLLKDVPNNTLTNREFTSACNKVGFTLIKDMQTIPYLAATKVALLRKML